MKNWPTWEVRFWDLPENSNINRCFGNSLKRVIKARTKDEAINKVKKKHSGFFILRHVYQYQEDDVVGIDINGSVLQWDGLNVYNCGESLEEFGLHNLTLEEKKRLGLD